MFRKSYRRHLTSPEMREQQANVFAAFVAMPRQTFIPFAGSLIRNKGFSDGIFVDDETWESDLALHDICSKLSTVYGVSVTAAKIHLKELGMLMNYHEYARLMNQQAVSW